MISQQQILINSSYTNTVSHHTKNPMSESKKFGMKGLQNPRINLSDHNLKILDRHYTPKKIKVIGTDITTKSKYWILPSLVCCEFLIKHNFLSFLFINNKNFKK